MRASCSFDCLPAKYMQSFRNQLYTSEAPTTDKRSGHSSWSDVAKGNVPRETIMELFLIALFNYFLKLMVVNIPDSMTLIGSGSFD